MLYEMFCGEIPRGVFQPPSQRVNCDSRVDRIIYKAMQQTPEKRYQSAAEMEADVSAARTPLSARKTGVVNVPRQVKPQAPAVRPVPVRPVAHSHRPVVVSQSSSSGGIWIIMVICVVVALLLFAPWKKGAKAPAQIAEATPAPTPIPATPTPPPATPTPAPVAVVEAPPPPEDTTAKATPKPQSEVEKWLADIDAQQNEAFDKQVTKPHETGMQSLRARYIATMDSGIAKASTSGRLDQAVAWRNEKQSYTETQIILANDAAVLPDIRAWRVEYRNHFAKLEEQRMARAKVLFASCDSILTGNIKLLTQRQRLDDALLLENKRREIAANWLKANIVFEAPKPTPMVAPPTPPPVANGLPTNADELRKYLLAWDWVKVKDGKKLEFASDGESASVESHSATYRVSGRRNLTMQWSTKSVDCEMNDDFTELRESSASRNVFVRTAKAPGSTGAQTPAPKRNGSSVSLLDLKLESSEVAEGELMLGGFAYLGGRVLVNGEECKTWIGACAPSKILYNLPPGVKAFSAIATCTDGQGGKSETTWVYVVKVDGKKLYTSPKLDPASGRDVPIDVAIPEGAKTLELIVEKDGERRKPGTVWANPMLWK